MRKRRILALALGCAIAASVGWLGLRHAPAPAPVLLLRAPDSVQALYAERRKYAAAWNPATAPPGKRHLPRFPIPESVARQLFPIKDVINPYDEQTYVRRLPNMNDVMPWKEHSTGQLRLRTNSLGMRDHAEPRAIKPDLRILVTGDSHSEGACNTYEAYTKVLQVLLSRAHPGKSIEGLNAAKGSFTFYSYLATLEKFLYLKPDVFLVGVYGPNDFEEILAPYHYFEGTPRRPGAANYWPLVEKAIEVSPQWLAQDGLSLKFFQRHPAEIPVALRAARQAILDIQELCQANGVLLGFLYIPGLFDTMRRRATGDPELEAVSRKLYDAIQLAPEDLGVHDRMADELLAYLAERGIPALDVRKIFAGRKERFFWLADHHIDVDAHRVIGEALVPFVESMSPPGLR